MHGAPVRYAYQAPCCYHMMTCMCATCLCVVVSDIVIARVPRLCAFLCDHVSLCCAVTRMHGARLRGEAWVLRWNPATRKNKQLVLPLIPFSQSQPQEIINRAAFDLTGQSQPQKVITCACAAFDPIVSVIPAFDLTQSIPATGNRQLCCL